MPFRITPNVRVKKDNRGITRQLNHPRQPYSAASVDSAVAPQTRRELADQYLREVLPAYDLEPDMASDLSGAVGASLQTGEGPRMRFEGEKVVRDQATVTYAQTHAGVPVWEAGLTVRMRGRQDHITGSQSSIHHGIEMEPPPEDSPDWPEKIDESVLERLLGLTETPPSLQINTKPLIIYQYDAGNRGACGPDPDDRPDESQVHGPELRLDPPPVPESIRSGRHYVIADVQFTLTYGPSHDINWSAFIEPETGAVLLLRAFVSGVDGFVFLRDPLTATGNTAIQPDSSAAVLNGARDRVSLAGLITPAGGAATQLSGEFVELRNITPPPAPPPTVVPPAQFFYPVPTDNFSAVNAYHH